MAALEDASTRNNLRTQDEPDHRDETMVVKVSGDGNGLVDDETTGHGVPPSQPEHPSDGKTANERHAGEGDEDSASQ